MNGTLLEANDAAAFTLVSQCMLIQNLLMPKFEFSWCLEVDVVLPSICTNMDLAIPPLTHLYSSGRISELLQHAREKIMLAITGWRRYSRALLTPNSEGAYEQDRAQPTP